MNFKWMRRAKTITLAVLALAVAGAQPACHAAQGSSEGIQNSESHIRAQELVSSPRAPEGPVPAKWSFGSEIDALPFLSKGYYGSGFAGHDGWKFRGVAARSTVPSFMVSDGFRDKRTDAYALLADRFVRAKGPKLEGLWIGGGAEYWRNRIRTKDAPAYANYHDVMLTAGVGYVWKISRHFYLNPWAAGHVAVAGDRSILVSGKTYKQPVFTPEGSVKLGFTF